jgi:NTP pyrophosphatase (non-canonical NTP hydrolase)
MKKNILFIFLLAVLVLNSGCHSLRKKFIRKKNKKDVPVYVTPKEYPQKPTRDIYVDYYLYTKGWLGELIKALRKGISHKRQKHAIGEAIMNLEQIISFFNQEGRDAIGPLHDQLKKIQKEIKQIPNLSRYKRDSLVRKTQNIKREFDSNYTYTDIKEWLN